MGVLMLCRGFGFLAYFEDGWPNEGHELYGSAFVLAANRSLRAAQTNAGPGRLLPFSLSECVFPLRRGSDSQ